MNAIENYYHKKGIKVLSERKENIVKKGETNISKTAKNAKLSFVDQLFKKTNKKVISGIKNDVLLKEMEEKPALISNLIQYTPANIVLSLIEGNNVKNGDLLFGLLQ
jgi:hypothetical protein